MRLALRFRTPLVLYKGTRIFLMTFSHILSGEFLMLADDVKLTSLRSASAVLLGNIHAIHS